MILAYLVYQTKKKQDFSPKNSSKTQAFNQGCGVGVGVGVGRSRRFSKGVGVGIGVGLSSRLGVGVGVGVGIFYPTPTPHVHFLYLLVMLAAQLTRPRAPVECSTVIFLREPCRVSRDTACDS